jgi:uncharacterized protein (DUF1800 family)
MARPASKRKRIKRVRRKKVCAPRKRSKTLKGRGNQHVATGHVSRKKRSKARVCKPKKVKRSPLLPSGVPAASQPQTGMTPPPSSGAVPTPPAPPAPPTAPISSPIPKYTGSFGVAQAHRLLFRAGFGPRPGEAEKVAKLGLEKAVMALTRPTGSAVLTGPAPVDEQGKPIQPLDASGHDHAYWLDRMIRSNQQLVERMALIYHDWFATSIDGGGHNQGWMLEQTNIFRRYAFGSFKSLVRDISADRAMICWLSCHNNHKGAVNENYGRELMELFTLGADRGAYTEQDVREAARALTGYKAIWMDEHTVHPYIGEFEFDPSLHDDGVKTLFGKSGNFDWTDVARMVVEHPMHPSFFVTKLWSYFIPTPPSDAVRKALERVYVSSGYSSRPVIEAILCSPQLYDGAAMVKPPVVYHAGMMRARNKFITSGAWHWYSAQAGQRLYWPPDVSGWDDKRWMDTNTARARWDLATQVKLGEHVVVATYDGEETPAQAIDRACAFWAQPRLSASTRAELVSFGQTYGGTAALNGQRQNLLRHLIPSTPDYLTC